jgi:hypothetical protein
VKYARPGKGFTIFSIQPLRLLDNALFLHALLAIYTSLIIKHIMTSAAICPNPYKKRYAADEFNYPAAVIFLKNVICIKKGALSAPLLSDNH